MTVRQAIVMFACRDMARAMWRVTTGSTTFADCKRPSFDGRRNRVGSEQCVDAALGHNVRLETERVGLQYDVERNVVISGRT